MSFFDNLGPHIREPSEYKNYMNDFNAKNTMELNPGNQLPQNTQGFIASNNMGMKYVINQSPHGVFYQNIQPEQQGYQTHYQLVNPINTSAHNPNQAFPDQNYKFTQQTPIPKIQTQNTYILKETVDKPYPAVKSQPVQQFDVSKIPQAMNDLLKDVGSNIDQSNSGALISCQNLVRTFLIRKLDVDSFASMMEFHKFYQFNSNQIQTLRNYYRCSNENPVDVVQAQKNYQLKPNNVNVVYSKPNQISKIPQLTMVQNSNRVCFNLYEKNIPAHAPQNNLRLSQVVRAPGNQSYLKQLSDIHEAKLASLPQDKNTDQSSVKQSQHEDEPDTEFYIGGVNIEEEENMLGKAASYIKTKWPSDQHLIFNTKQIKSKIENICKKIIMILGNDYKINIDENQMSSIINKISYALEYKLFQVLQKSILQVHHRLKNFDFKATKTILSNIEPQITFMEEVIIARDPKKSDKNKSKAKNDSIEAKKASRQLEEAYSKINASNAMVLASVKGQRKVENVWIYYKI
ncbi:hypothetical protein HZS_1307 [Henneguya salminicola]|nr:hypothetical protein HZS_1307 [Henneguya salminicola]